MRSRAELERLIARTTLLHAKLVQQIDALGDGTRLVIDEQDAVRMACLVQDIAAALGECLPEERAERCWCEKCIGWVWGVPCWDDGICDDWDGCAESGCPRCNEEGDPPPCGTDDPKPQWLYEADHSWGTDAWGTHPKFCPDCGAHLGEDGVARRNAAVRQVDMVREWLQRFESGASGSDVTPGYKAGVLSVTSYIRTALGPQGGGDQCG